MKVALPCALWEICILSALVYLGRQNRSVICFSVLKPDVLLKAAVYVCGVCFSQESTFGLFVVLKTRKMSPEAQRRHERFILWGELTYSLSFSASIIFSFSLSWEEIVIKHKGS